MKFYLIHGLERKRRIFMQVQLRHSGIPSTDVTWINNPNKDDPLPAGITNNPDLTIGQVAITYKHYLALKDIVEKKLPVAVIMEDNIEFLSSIPEKLSQYLAQLPEDWDCVFDSDFFDWHFIESPIEPGKLVYKKSNEPTEQCGGASKGAHFLMVSNKGAEALLSSFLPFNNVSDHYYNYLAKKLRLNCYWAEPPNIHKIQRESTWR
jgi:hypothetical protein